MSNNFNKQFLDKQELNWSELNDHDLFFDAFSEPPSLSSGVDMTGPTKVPGINSMQYMVHSQMRDMRLNLAAYRHDRLGRFIRRSRNMKHLLELFGKNYGR